MVTDLPPFWATWTREILPESVWTANPMQTTGIFGVKRGFAEGPLTRDFHLHRWPGGSAPVFRV